jgi:hypothetical protein
MARLRRCYLAPLFSAHVSCSLDVKLDPTEHQNYVWAAEEEVKARKVGDVNLKFTTGELEAVVLEAFRARREMSADGGE